MRNLSSCDRSVKAGAYLRLLALRIQIKGLTVSNLFNTAQHVLLTAITAAIVVFHLCLLICTGLRCSQPYQQRPFDLPLPDLSRKIEGPLLAGYCSQGAGYAISACFIRFIEVKSTSPFPTTLPPCLRMAVQGRVMITTLTSSYHPLQSTLTNTLSL